LGVFWVSGFFNDNFDDITDNEPDPGQDPGYGRTKEGYEGDTVQLTCSDENRRGNIRVIFYNHDFSPI
jgi:hypothetical protein